MRRKLLACARGTAVIVVVFLLSFAGYWSVRLAWAEILFRRDTIASVSRAIALVPGNARYPARRAALLQADLKDEPALADLARAVALNPRDSMSQVELGLRAEMRGDFGEAQRRLLEAARVDRTYLPRWALANYYFRRGESSRFFSWARAAAEMAYDDPAPLFRLCWALEPPDPTRILARAIPPDKPAVLREYLSFLLHDHPEAAAPAAAVLLSRAGPADASALLDTCDRFIATGQIDAALRIWNALAERRLIGASPVRPGTARVLLDGRLPHPARGFSWRTSAPEGVLMAQAPDSVRITFTGEQPEECEPLSEWLPLSPGDYTLSFRYRTSGIPPATGLRWQIAGGAESADLSSEDWTDASLRFAAPAGSGFARLALKYHRRSGTTRIEGSAWLSQIRLEPLR